MATATAMANRIRNKVKLMAIHVAYNLPHSNSATTVPRTETEIDTVCGRQRRRQCLSQALMVKQKQTANKFQQQAIKKR